MSLTKPGDREAVGAAAAEFFKLCERHGIKMEQVMQVSIAVGAASLRTEAKGDKEYTAELLERYVTSFRSAVNLPAIR